MSEKKFIGIIVAAGCGLALILIVGIVLSKNAKTAAREKEIAALAAKLGESVSKSNEYIRNRDFERATSTLQAIEPSIVTIGDYSLKGQYDQAFGRLAEAERSHTAKVKKGWTVFEGKLISPEEKEQVSAERKRKALADKLDRAVAESKEQMRLRDYGGSSATLRAIEQEIVNSGYSDLAEELAQATHAVIQAEADYQDKRQKGYVDFEGRLVAPSTRDRILAERETRLTQPQSRKRPGKWYEGGTLAKASVLEWQVATADDKLATCADFVAYMWVSNSFVPRIQNSITSVDDMKPYAQELVEFLDAATERDADPEQNRRMFANQTVASFAAIGMMTMRWLK